MFLLYINLLLLYITSKVLCIKIYSPLESFSIQFDEINHDMKLLIIIYI